VIRSATALVCAALLALVLAAPAAATYLSKADARLEANSKAYELASHKTWASSIEVGGCARRSAARVNCAARVSGDEFKTCDDAEPFTCHYVFHRCSFTVAVHAAGYFAKGQIHGIRCSTRQHTG
jgi:hypothetical protein